MIISRTPLRMSFVGGGSDIPTFYKKHGKGAVVSAAIDKYVYVTVNQKFDDKIRVSYSRTEEVEHAAEIQHPLVREAMQLLKMDGGIEITSVADIPSRGTGLGSSSSFTVGLLHALHAFKGRYASAERLAREACCVELDRCGEPIGKQDQYAAAFGGLNFIQFYPDDSVSVDPILCSPATMCGLKESIICFYTGIARSASDILKTQQAEVARSVMKQDAIKRMVELAFALKTALEVGDVPAVGRIVHQNWELKKALVDGITSPELDRWYSIARANGATGGKLLGAGTGGFLLFIAERESHAVIEKALTGLRRVRMGFEPQGSKIIFVHD